MEFPSTGLAPFLSIISILSIIPILQANDTLPDTKAQERDMKRYAEKMMRGTIIVFVLSIISMLIGYAFRMFLAIS